EVAVVVGGEGQRGEAGVRGAAVRLRGHGRAGVGVAARSVPGLVPELVGELPGRRRVEPRGREVAGREIPEGLAGEIALAVDFLAAGAAAAVARRDERGDARRRV